MGHSDMARTMLGWPKFGMRLKKHGAGLSFDEGVQASGGYQAYAAKGRRTVNENIILIVSNEVYFLKQLAGRFLL